jgi:hypothetical protein
MIKLQPAANHSSLDVSAGVEAEPDGVIVLDSELAAIWEFAAPYLKVRDNDAHTLYAFGLARALLVPGSPGGGVSGDRAGRRAAGPGVARTLEEPLRCRQTH